MLSIYRHIDIVKELIVNGADVNQKDCNKTPLTAACEGQHMDVIEELIKAREMSIKAMR